MKKNIKLTLLFLFIAAIVAVACLLYNNLSDKTTKRINSIDNYETVFDAVDKLEFYIQENNFYSTQSPAKELRIVKNVKISPTPISEDKNAVRDYEYKIVVNDKFTIYINSDFSQLWLDDIKNVKINYDEGTWNKETDKGLLPSFSYSIENPEILEELFRERSQHINK